MLLALVMAAGAGQAQAAWRVEATRDALRETTKTMAFGTGQAGRLVVGVRCIDGDVDVLISTRDILGPSWAEVSYRIDGGEIVTDKWEVTGSLEAAWAEHPGRLARAMAAGNRIVFEVITAQGKVVQDQLSLAGSSAAIGQVLAACGQTLAGLAPEDMPPPAPPPPPPPPAILSVPITNAEWARRPSPDDIARYYPERAQRLGQGGKAIIECTVSSTWTLENCSVVYEDPHDGEFGSAMLRMSRLFRIAAVDGEGQPTVGRRVRVPVVFQPPKE